VESCTFSDNTATYGGGMYNYLSSSPTVTNTTFSANSAEEGGGMLNEDNSTPTVESCTLSDNTATSYGGGMYNYLSSSPTVTNCSFFANTADIAGGGIMNEYNSSPTVTNTTFSANTANSAGGGMINYDNASPTVTNCTFSGNIAIAGDSGGGMYNDLDSSPIVTNSILWGDSPDEIYNVSATPSVTYSDIQGGYAGTGNIDADPLFVDPDGPDNIAGNEDDDLHLKSGSPCIDTGTPSGAPATDLEGNSRPQGAGYDMGAYESLLAKIKAMPWLLLLLGT
jgi:parallel beta-helix repeat protein